MKNSHWEYLEPTHVIGFVLSTFVFGFFFAVAGALVGAVTGHWWVPLAVVLLSPFAALWVLSRQLKGIQRRMEGEI